MPEYQYRDEMMLSGVPFPAEKYNQLRKEGWELVSTEEAKNFPPPTCELIGPTARYIFKREKPKGDLV